MGTTAKTRPQTHRKKNDREIRIVREYDDLTHRTRILASEVPAADDSKAWVRDTEPDYLLFRGDPEAVVRLLRRLLEHAEADLLNHHYARRGESGAFAPPRDL